MLQSARNARKAGHDEKIVLACLLHDVALGGLIRADHGYWGAQMIAPYVDEEVAWAVKHHQALRYFADPAVNYEYPAAYVRFWGPDYKIPDYLTREYEAARQHRWYRKRAGDHAVRSLFLRGRRRNRSRRIRGRRRPPFQATEGRPRLRQFARRPYVAHDHLADEFSLSRHPSGSPRLAPQDDDVYIETSSRRYRYLALARDFFAHRSRTATISAPGKRSSTARTSGSCITLSSRAALADFFCSASVGAPPSRAT